MRKLPRLSSSLKIKIKLLYIDNHDNWWKREIKNLNISQGLIGFGGQESQS